MTGSTVLRGVGDSDMEAEQKGCYQARLRRRTGAYLAMEWMASCAHRLPLVEDSAASLLLVSCTPRGSGQEYTETSLFRFLFHLASLLQRTADTGHMARIGTQ